MDHVVIELDRDFDGGFMERFLYHAIPVPDDEYYAKNFSLSPIDEYSLWFPDEDELHNADIDADTDLSSIYLLVNCRITVTSAAKGDHEITSKILIGCVVVCGDGETTLHFNECVFLHTAIFAPVICFWPQIWNGCMMVGINLAETEDLYIMGVNVRDDYEDNYITLEEDSRDKINRIVPYTYVANLYRMIDVNIMISGEMKKVLFELDIYSDEDPDCIVEQIRMDGYKSEEFMKKYHVLIGDDLW